MLRIVTSPLKLSGKVKLRVVRAQQIQSLLCPRNFGTSANVESAQGSSNEQQKKKPDDDDFLSKHGGKVAIAALSIAAGLIYTYYLSIQDRSNVEKAIENYEMILEPYEMLDLRNANQIKSEQVLKLFHLYLEQKVADNDGVINPSSSLEPSESFKAIRDLPTLTYRNFIKFIQENNSTLQQNNSFIFPPPQNTLLLSYLLDRLVMSQIEGLVANSPNHSQYSFSMFKELTEEEQEKLKEESQNKLSGKIFIAEKNKELFRLSSLASNSNQESTFNEQNAIEYLDYPLSYDYLFMLLTLLMQEKSFPDNIQCRLATLFTIALSIQSFQSNNSSSLSVESDEVIKEAEQKGRISRDVMLRIIYLLQITNQFPAEKQVIETGVKWPVKLHRRKSPFDMIKVYEEQQKKELQEWDFEEFEKFLISNFNCVWGICYHDQKQLIHSKSNLKPL